MEQIYLSEHYPLIYSKDNVCLTNNGDTFLCYVLELPEIFTLSREDYVAMHDFWFRTIKNLPSNTVIHKQDIFLKETFTGHSLPDTSFLQKATKKHFTGRTYLNHYSLLFIGNTKHNSLKSSSLSNPFKRLPKNKNLKVENKLNNEFIDEVNKSIEFLNSSKYIKAIALTEKDIEIYIKNFFNGFDSDKNVDTDFNAKVKTKSKEYNVVGVGEQRVGVYTIQSTKQLPEYVDLYKLDVEYSSKKFEFYKGAADDFSFRLNFNHIYNQVIFITNRQQEKRKLESKKDNLFGSRGFSQDNETAANQVKEYLMELSLDESKIIVYGHTNILFYAKSDQEFEYNSKKIAATFKNLDYKASYPNKSLIKDIYVKSLFTYSPRLTINQIYQTELHIALTTFLNTTSYKNDDNGIIFSDRVFNIPIKKDVRDEAKKRIKAWNFAVYGPTGEGKSVLMQHVFRQFNEDGYKVVIFDIGGSFRKLSYLLPKDKSIFFSYEPGESLGINPFYIKDDSNVNIEFLNNISDFVYKLWKPGKELNNEKLTVLRKIINAYYVNIKENHSFPNLYNFINSNKEELLNHLKIDKRFFDLEDFLLYCSDFVEDGQYAFLFKNNEDVTKQIEGKDLIIFEFDKADQDDIMMSILIHLGSFAVDKIIWSDKSIEGVLFFDEMAKFIKNPSIREKYTFYYQAIRKQTAAVGSAFQSPSQLPKGDDINSVVDNTQVLYILNNEKGYLPIVERYGLSNHQHNMLKSITSNFKNKNPYIEFGLIIGKEIWILRLELPKEALYAYQTDGKQYDQIMELYDQSKNMETAINTFIKNN